MSDHFFEASTLNHENLEITWYKNIEKTDKAVIFIVHGLAEHACRYRPLAEEIKKRGFGTATFDLPGHGRTAKTVSGYGVWPEKGFNVCIETVRSLLTHIKNKYDKDIILLGHSMGSFISLGFINRYGELVKGCILSGTNDEQPIALLQTGRILASVISRIKGRDEESRLLNSMSFGSFNKHFKPNESEFDWLSRDSENVRKYINDPACGFIPSAGLFKDLLEGLADIYKPKNTGKIPKGLPVHIFAGENDPVGEFGKGPRKLYDRLKNAGMEKVSLMLHKDSRHECLNDLDRDEVIENILCFCEDTIG